MGANRPSYENRRRPNWGGSRRHSGANCLGTIERLPIRLESLGRDAQGRCPEGEITLLVVEAAWVRAITQAAAKEIVIRVSGIVSFYLRIRGAVKVDLTGEQSVLVLRGYSESLAERGRTAPSAANRAFSVWVESLGIDWPLAIP